MLGLPDCFDLPAPTPIIHQCPNCEHPHMAEPPNGLLVICKCDEMLEIYEEGIYWVGNRAIPWWANGGRDYTIRREVLERLGA